MQPLVCVSQKIWMETNIQSVKKVIAFYLDFSVEIFNR